MVVHYAINKSQIAEILKETFNTYDKDREYCLGLLNETMDMVSKNYEVIQYYNYDIYNYKYNPMINLEYIILSYYLKLKKS